MKKKWYVWDGDISKDMSFVSDVTGVLFRDGYKLTVNDYYNDIEGSWLWEHCDEGSDIVAYTLN